VKRNETVERAVRAAIERIDAYINGAQVKLPEANCRRQADAQLAHRSASVRVASMFLAFYAVEDPPWNCDGVPTGVRGMYGDKLLAELLSQRNISLHDNITAYGENLGWKGNVLNVRLSRDPRFKDFAAVLREASPQARRRVAEYMAARFAESRQELKPLPLLGGDVLTFAKSKLLFTQLLMVPSEGHIQQFLIAALLAVHRAKHGFYIRTHHPHAADRYDETAGDIEELHDGSLVRAYEVTVRRDWKNRVSVFRAKMDNFGLSKYVIIASGVNADEELAEPARLITFLKPHGRDIAVVDIADVATVMAAELTAMELRDSVNIAYGYLCQPKLCGRTEFQAAYRAIVDQWLDGQAET
jgi:hypothetical protein